MSQDRKSVTPDARRGLIIDARVTFQVPVTQGQGQGSSGHRPKGGSPYGHMVSAHRPARSRIPTALQDMDGKRQHRAADRARDEEPSSVSLPSKEPASQG